VQLTKWTQYLQPAQVELVAKLWSTYARIWHYLLADPANLIVSNWQLQQECELFLDLDALAITVLRENASDCYVDGTNTTVPFTTLTHSCTLCGNSLIVGQLAVFDPLTLTPTQRRHVHECTLTWSQENPSQLVICVISANLVCLSNSVWRRCYRAANLHGVGFDSWVNHLVKKFGE